MSVKVYQPLPQFLIASANAALGPGDAQRAVARLAQGDLLVMQLEIPMAVIATNPRGFSGVWCGANRA